VGVSLPTRRRPVNAGPATCARFAALAATETPGRHRKRGSVPPSHRQSLPQCALDTGQRTPAWFAARGRASSYSCVGDCGRPAVDWAYDNDDPDEVIDTVGGKPLRYGLDSDHYQPMCRQCHQRFDHAQRAQRLEVFSSW